jgi:type II secretory pathway component PulF
MVEVLTKLADMLDGSYQLNKSVKAACMYPACVVGALTLALAFLLAFVVPRFSNMFSSRGVDLPVPTLMLLNMSKFLTSYWYVVIGVTVATVWGVYKAWQNPRSRNRIDTWLHKVPFVRSILKGVAVSRFSHVFGLTLRSGLSLIDALEVSGRASGRPLLQSDAKKMQDQVKHGGQLSDVMMRCGYLPGFAKRLYIAGEEAAELTRMCEIVGRHYDREVGYLTKNISTAIEPIMVIGLAAIVLIVALAIFLPMWNMASLM